MMIRVIFSLSFPVGKAKYDQRMDLRGAAVRYVIDQSVFLMISSYSRQFCLGFTQCGPLFSIYLTDRGENSTKMGVDVTHEGQAILSYSYMNILNL